MRQIIIAAALLAAVSANAVDFTPPDGFRGHKWGSAPSELLGGVLAEDGGDSKCYTRKAEDLMIGDANLDTVAYCYYKDRLYFGLMYFNGIVNFSGLKSALFQKYGEGLKLNQFMEKYIWSSPTVFINAEYSEVTRKGKISMSYMPISNEQKQDSAAKAKAAGDKL